MACDTAAADALMPNLRAVVRNCPHAVLVTTQCFMGAITCAASRSQRGAMLLLQPCAVDRTPTAAVRLIGPVITASDSEAVCQWIACGVWDLALLPTSLSTRMNAARVSQLN